MSVNVPLNPLFRDADMLPIFWTIGWSRNVFTLRPFDNTENANDQVFCDLLLSADDGYTAHCSFRFRNKLTLRHNPTLRLGHAFCRVALQPR